jgi:hypothetical protein
MCGISAGQPAGNGLPKRKSELIWLTIFQTGTEAKLTIGRPE